MEHKKKIWLKGILAVALFVIVFITYLNPVFAEINTEYFSTTGATQEDVNSAAKNNTLLSPIGGFVYAIGNIVEWLLSSLSSAATGMNTMPWADMILYNSVAMLDVNFLNPNTNSLIYGMQGIIQKVYFTIFSLAISFFGIAVVIMAIKLAVSSIAEEKAKYKSAITSWLMAVVLLFTMHYFMAFVFYLNESVVNLASKIATDAVKDNPIQIGNETMESLMNLIIKNAEDTDEDTAREKGKLTYEQACLFINRTFPVTCTIEEKTDPEVKRELKIDKSSSERFYDAKMNAILKMIFNNPDSNFSKWIYNSESFNTEEEKGNMTMWMIINFEKSIYRNYDLLDGINEAYNKYLEEESDKNKEEYINKISEAIGNFGDFKMSNFDRYWNDWMKDEERRKKKLRTETSFFDFSVSYLNYMNMYYNSDQISDSDNEYSNYSESTSSLIASYFKSQAWDINKNTLQTTDANVTFCFLYTIFVIQSLLYFFAYIKRLFYIIVLALMAPVVVVYDFVSKI